MSAQVWPISNAKSPRLFGTPVLIFAALFFSSQAALTQFSQQGPKLVGSGAVNSPFPADQGVSVALSADGNTAVVGGTNDNSVAGAVWVYFRSGGVWTQQGSKLVGSGAVITPPFASGQGFSVALSGDGDTAIVGGPGDNSDIGAAWVYTRSGNVWIQQGSKLVANDAVALAEQGWSVGLSADGNTAIVGGWGDNTGIGAAWVFTRDNGVWTQQGNKLVGSGAVQVTPMAAGQGRSVALSGDGNTAIVGGYYDNDGIGAAWAWTRTSGVWTQQGSKLVGSGAVGKSVQGASVALSGDGNTAIVGGYYDNTGIGAAWVFTRNNGVWTQHGNKLVGSGATGAAYQGTSVALSSDGNIAIVGGPNDGSGAGATWIFSGGGGVWTQQGNKLVATGGVGSAAQGNAVALSGDGNIAIVGGPGDNGEVGAAWVFVQPPSLADKTDTHDFNGDGYSDIAWQDGSGDLALWLMSSATVLSSNGIGSVPTVWSIVGQRDFNGDGMADLLWRDTSGDTAMWFMNGTTVASTASVGNVPINWSVVGVADFNGDGLGDLLWRDSTGDIALWLMSGATVMSSAGLGNVPTATWNVVGTADFNGDGMADILWRDTSGNAAIWFMNGTVVSSTAGIGNIPTNWSVVGTGDFNGDGMADIAWRDTTGDTGIWLMNGAAVSSAAGLGTIPTTWSIALAGDYNGDGKSDLLWRDTSGDTAMWFMNGTTIASTAGVGNVPTNWTVQSVNAE